MKQVITGILISSILTLSMGQSYAHVKNQQRDSLILLYQNYDEKSADASANLADLQEKLNSDVQKSLKDLPESQVRDEIEDLLNEIPNKQKREALIKQLKFSTTEELAALLTEDNTILDALAGEGANYGYSSRRNKESRTLIFGIIIVSVAVILLAQGGESSSTTEPESEIKTYSSYTRFIPFSDPENNFSCPSAQAVLSPIEYDEMRNDAKFNCQDEAQNCRFDTFLITEYPSECKYQAIYKGTVFY